MEFNENSIPSPEDEQFIEEMESKTTSELLDHLKKVLRLEDDEVESLLGNKTLEQLKDLVGETQKILSKKDHTLAVMGEEVELKMEEASIDLGSLGDRIERHEVNQKINAELEKKARDEAQATLQEQLDAQQDDNITEDPEDEVGEDSSSKSPGLMDKIGSILKSLGKKT